MARKRDKRSRAPKIVEATNNENYEGDDEAREESPAPISTKVTDEVQQEPQIKAQKDQIKSQKDQIKGQKDQSKGQKDQGKGQKDQSKGQKDQIKAQEDPIKSQQDPIKSQQDPTKSQQDQIKDQKPSSKNGKKKKKSKKDDEEFEVDQIVGMEVNSRWRCPVRFRVRWVGFGEKDDTWVSEDNLNCENFVEDFLQISGRTSEFEKAMEEKRLAAEAVSAVGEGRKEALRGTLRVQYNERDSDEDDVVYQNYSTRTRKTKSPAYFDPSDARPQLGSKKPSAKPFGVSRALARAQQAGREYEVVLIVDHRVRGRFTEYKVRWKGMNSSHDSWVAEGNLTCPKLIANYQKNISTEPEPEYEVAAIIDSREVEGLISYKVRWKGFSTKFDSWLPKDEMNCPSMIDKFEAALEKLNKKEDWVVSKIKERRDRNNTVEYLVSWEGFDSKHDTWEPEQNLKSCQDKLDKFATVQQKPTKKQKQSSAGEESDREDLEEEEEDTHDEDIVVKGKKRKRPSTGKSMKPSKSESRRRRITLPVSYEEGNDEYDE